MKKVLSLVLAVMMLATVAFALDVTPGTKLKFDVDLNSGELTGNGNTVVIEKTHGTGYSGDKEFNTTNFSISSVKWTKGSDLVKSVTINSDEQVVLELKQNYTLQANKNKSIVGSFKVTEKGKSKSCTYEVGYKDATANPAIDNTFYVGYEWKLWDLDVTDLGEPLEDTIYEIDKATSDGTTYATISFADGLGNDINVRVYDGEKYYLESSTDPDLDIVKKYDDADADLRFVSFPAAPTFNATATYYIYADEDEFVYTIKNGAVTASGAKWSDDDGCWVLKARTLGSYVISDKKLSVSTSSGDSETPIPDTGANDVVGIASALAVVALVSAAAISLKK